MLSMQVFLSRCSASSFCCASESEDCLPMQHKVRSSFSPPRTYFSCQVRMAVSSTSRTSAICATIHPVPSKIIALTLYAFFCHAGVCATFLARQFVRMSIERRPFSLRIGMCADIITRNIYSASGIPKRLRYSFKSWTGVLRSRPRSDTVTSNRKAIMNARPCLH